MLKSRPVVTKAGVSRYFEESRMAEWLRSRASLLRTDLNIRRIRGGSKTCSLKKSIGWAVGAKVTSRRYYGRRKPILVGGQDGRVVKAGALGGTYDKVACDRTWSNSDSQKAHRGRLVLKLRPVVTVAGVSQLFCFF